MIAEKSRHIHDENTYSYTAHSLQAHMWQ